jgi:hypothetical protein
MQKKKPEYKKLLYNFMCAYLNKKNIKIRPQKIHNHHGVVVTEGHALLKYHLTHINGITWSFF